MQKYADAEGREWRIAFSIGLAKQVLDETNKEVDLLRPHDGTPTLMQRLHDDLFLFVRVLFIAVSDQAKALGMDFEAFCRSLTGDVSYAASEAFNTDWADFFQGLHRQDLATVVKAHWEMVAKGTEVAEAKYRAGAEKAKGMLDAIDKMTLEEVLAKSPATATPGPTFGNTPASPA